MRPWLWPRRNGLLLLLLLRLGAATLTELAGEGVEQSSQLAAHLVVQRAQPAELLLGRLVTFPDRFLGLEQLLLGARPSVLSELLGLPADLGEHPLGVLARRLGLLRDLALALVQLDLSVGGLLLEHGRARDQGLFDLVAMCFGVLAGTLEQRRRLARRAGANLGGFLFRRAEQLLYPVPEALRRAATIATVGLLRAPLLELRLDVPQFSFGPVGPPALALMCVLCVREGGVQGTHVLIDLLAVVTATREVENIALGRLRRRLRHGLRGTAVGGTLGLPFVHGP
ncbi:MAG: hypothetical protein J2P19_08745 [Pseudonocardia sp.]|nr:hypothetical protein [Pseudonocardia sp.]